MPDWQLLLAIVVAIAIGHWLGRRSARVEEEDEDSFPLQSHYIKGINYLLNEQPDEAVETFIEALEVKPETLDTHLALGNLLRKRGEVGRAIRIHQNLLARPGLSSIHSQQVQLELAKDFIKSGLLDRAETLLQELVPEAEHSIRCASLEYLIEIYQDEKEWLKAIGVVNQLAGRRFGRIAERWRHIQAHFYCELADGALSKNDYLLARRHLKSALSVDRASVRAHLISAQLDHRQGRPREAIRSLKSIISEQPDYIPEALPLLLEIYHQSGRLQSLRQYLQSVYVDTPGASTLVAIAELTAELDGDSEAISYLAEQVALRPSLRGLDRLLALKASNSPEAESYDRQIFGVLQAVESGVSSYRCGQCGFSGNQLHWLCPSCKTWGSVRPVSGVEGE